MKPGGVILHRAPKSESNKMPTTAEDSPRRKFLEAGTKPDEQMHFAFGAAQRPTLQMLNFAGFSLLSFE